MNRPQGLIPGLRAALSPNCESAYQELESLNDLKKIDFEQFVPKHSLLLLHWFSNTVYIDNNDVILTFDPDKEEFGSHHYGNYDKLLDPLPLGQVRYRYYTVGNLHTETSNELPDYVLDPPLQDYEGTNRDRIIFRVREQNTGDHTIDQVYLTQHYHPHEHRGTRYNHEHTYQISTRLLRQIRMFSDEESSLTELRDHFHSNADDFQLRDFRNTWGQHLACIGLLLFIVIQEKYSTNRPFNRLPKNKLSENRPEPQERIETQPDYESGISNDYESDDSDTSQSILTMHTDKVQVDLTGKNENTSHPNEQGVSEVQVVKDEMGRKACNTLNQSSEDASTNATSVSLNNGVLKKIRPILLIIILSMFIVFIILTVIILVLIVSKGRCIQSPDGVPITDYNAWLQLFVRDGKACAHLYLDKSFTEWRSDFQQSWVGFYKSAEKDTKDYEWWQWQWATEFEPCVDGDDYNQFNCFKYCSDMAVAPGVQVRFMLRDNIVKAHTTQCDTEKKQGY